jgi:hypothetical protein
MPIQSELCEHFCSFPYFFLTCCLFAYTSNAYLKSKITEWYTWTFLVICDSRCIWIFPSKPAEQWQVNLSKHKSMRNVVIIVFYVSCSKSGNINHGFGETFLVFSFNCYMYTVWIICLWTSNITYMMCRCFTWTSWYIKDSINRQTSSYV